MAWMLVNSLSMEGGLERGERVGLVGGGVGSFISSRFSNNKNVDFVSIWRNALCSASGFMEINDANRHLILDKILNNTLYK